MRSLRMVIGPKFSARPSWKETIGSEVERYVILVSPKNWDELFLAVAQFSLAS